MQKWFMSGLLAACCLFAILVTFYSLKAGETPTAKPGPAPSASASGEAASAVDAEAAMAIYKTNCLSCHGDQLQGGMGPALAKVGATMSQADIHKQIANGGGGMPPFKSTLTAEQIDTLAVWLASKK